MSTAPSASSTVLSRNPSEDSGSVYFLGNQDHSGHSIVGDIFTGKNYISWSQGVEMALSIKNKIRFIDGTLPCPSKDQADMRICWNRANYLVISWLLNSVSKDLRQSLLYFKSARDLWLEIKTRYDRTDGSRVYHLHKSLSTITQNTHTITDYYNNFKSLWDEFVSQRPVIACSCGKCTCNVNATMIAQQQSDCVLKFLVGLTDSYAAIRSQILLMHPLPSLSRVYSMLLQEEHQRDLCTSNMPTESLAMFTRGKNSYDSKVFSNSQGGFNSGFNSQNTNQRFTGNKKDKKKLKCTHCGYTGHTINKCFQLIGYPPGWDGPTNKRSAPNPSANSVTAPPGDSSAQKSEVDVLDSHKELFQKFLALVNSSSTTKEAPHYVATAATSGPSHEEDDWFC